MVALIALLAKFLFAKTRKRKEICSDLSARLLEEPVLLGKS
jgi:hypothetical protein